MARPSVYNEKLAARVLAAVTDGATLTAASAACGVPRQTVRSWLERNPGFSAAFEAAKAIRVEVLSEQLEGRANQAWQVVADAKAAGINENAAIAALRVELENKRWLLAKLAPRQFGDRQQLEHTGAGGKDLYPQHEPPDRTKLALAILTELKAVFEARQPKTIEASLPEPPKPPPTILQTPHAAMIEAMRPPQPAEPPRLIYTAPKADDGKWAPWRFPRFP